jgi:hypothetical protein
MKRGMIWICNNLLDAVNHKYTESACLVFYLAFE